MTIEEKKEIIYSNGANTEQVLKILLELQDKSDKSYIDEETAKLVADEVGLSLTEIYNLLTFYAMLETKPMGKYIIEICNSTPCYYTKSTEVAEIIEKELGIKVGETTEDGLYSLVYTPCVGACDIGPVIKIKSEIYGNLTEDRIKSIIANLK